MQLWLFCNRAASFSSLRSPRWCSSFPHSLKAMPVPPAGASQTADHIDAAEDTPLLHDSRDPAETDENPTSSNRMGQQQPPSAVDVIASNSFTGPTGWAAQVGLVVATVVLWRVLWVHPAGESSRGRLKLFVWAAMLTESDNRVMSARSGLFTYHPALQSLAALGFLEGVLDLPIFTSQRHHR